MRLPRSLAQIASTVVLSMSLAVVVLVGAGAVKAARGSTPPCAAGSKALRPLCNGTAVVRVGRTSTHYSAVTCYIDKATGRPLEVWKRGGFLLNVAFGPTARKTKGATMLTHGAGKKVVSATRSITVVLSKTSLLRGTFSGRADAVKTLISGSFTCKK